MPHHLRRPERVAAALELESRQHAQVAPDAPAVHRARHADVAAVHPRHARPVHVRPPLRVQHPPALSPAGARSRPDRPLRRRSGRGTEAPARLSFSAWFCMQPESEPPAIKPESNPRRESEGSRHLPHIICQSALRPILPVDSYRLSRPLAAAKAGHSLLTGTRPGNSAHSESRSPAHAFGAADCAVARSFASPGTLRTHNVTALTDRYVDA